MKAFYLGVDATQNYATFIVWAFRKIYLPLSEVRFLTDSELNQRLTDACQWFSSLPVTLC